MPIAFLEIPVSGGRHTVRKAGEEKWGPEAREGGRERENRKNTLGESEPGSLNKPLGHLLSKAPDEPVKNQHTSKHRTEIRCVHGRSSRAQRVQGMTSSTVCSKMNIPRFLAEYPNTTTRTRHRESSTHREYEYRVRSLVRTRVDLLQHLVDVAAERFNPSLAAAALAGLLRGLGTLLAAGGVENIREGRGDERAHSAREKQGEGFNKAFKRSRGTARQSSQRARRRGPRTAPHLTHVCKSHNMRDEEGGEHGGECPNRPGRGLGHGFQKMARQTNP